MDLSAVVTEVVKSASLTGVVLGQQQDKEWLKSGFLREMPKQDERRAY